MPRPIGIQIRHRSLRSCLVTVGIGWKEMPFNPEYGKNGRCPTCNVVHTVKTYHLNINDAGCCIVNRKVFENLCRAGAIDGVPPEKVVVPNGERRWRALQAPPFEYVGEVEPPPLNIGLGERSGIVRDGEGRVLYRPGMRIMHVHEDYD